MNYKFFKMSSMCNCEIHGIKYCFENFTQCFVIRRHPILKHIARDWVRHDCLENLEEYINLTFVPQISYDPLETDVVTEFTYLEMLIEKSTTFTSRLFTSLALMNHVMNNFRLFTELELMLNIALEHCHRFKVIFNNILYNESNPFNSWYDILKDFS